MDKNESKGNPKYSHDEMQIIKENFANGATDTELNTLLYLAEKYKLDIIAGEIFCIKKGTGKAQIYAGKNGFLNIAHASGQFDGVKTGSNGSIKEGNLVGYCEIFRKDTTHSFYIEVDFNEYASNYGIWQTKPKTMIEKVAMSQCLRLAFNVSGMYGIEEMAQFNDELDKRENAKKSNKIDKDKTDNIPMSIGEKSLLREVAKSKGLKTNELIKEYALKTLNIDDMNAMTSERCKALTESMRTMETITVNQQLDLEKYEGSPLDYTPKERKSKKNSELLK